jgi:hypothetical protein
MVGGYQAYSLESSYDHAVLTKTIFCKLPARAAVRSVIDGHEHVCYAVVDSVETPRLPKVLASLVFK